MYEFINIVEIQGVVGQANVQKVNDAIKITLSVATNYTHLRSDKTICIDTTWFLIVVWTKENKDKLVIPQKDDWIHAKGRLRQCRAIDEDENVVQIYDVLATELSILEKQPQEI